MPGSNDSKPRAALALILAALTLAGCSATVAAGQPATDQAVRQAAIDATRAEADLAAALAFSNTLGTQAAQVDRLVNATIDQAAAWQAVATVLVVALAAVAIGGIAGAVLALIVAGRRGPGIRQPAVYVVAAPTGAPTGAPTMPELDPGIRHQVQAPSVLEVARYLAAAGAARRQRAALPAPDDVVVDAGDDAGDDVADDVAAEVTHG